MVKQVITLVIFSVIALAIAFVKPLAHNKFNYFVIEFENVFLIN